MRSASRFLNTGAGVNPTHLSMVPPGWTSSIEHEDVPQLGTVAKQTQFLDRLILLHLRSCKLSTRIWLGVAFYSAIESMLYTPFVDRFICRIFLTYRKAVPCHSQPISLLDRKRTLQDTRTSDTASLNPEQAVYRKKYYGFSYNGTGPVRRVVLPPNTQHLVFVATTSPGLLTNEPRAMLNSRHCTRIACRIMNTLQEKTFYNPASNFSDRQVHLYCAK